MKSDGAFRQGISLAIRLGVEMLVAVGIGGLMGNSLDYYLDTDPWFMAVGLLFGGAAGVLGAFRAASAVSPQDEEDPPENGSSGKSDDLLQ